MKCEACRKEMVEVASWSYGSDKGKAYLCARANDGCGRVIVATNKPPKKV